MIGHAIDKNIGNDENKYEYQYIYEGLNDENKYQSKYIYESLNDENKYENQYIYEGLQMDIGIIKIILGNDEKEVIDNGPRKPPKIIQVCTVKKGCWYE